MVETKVQFRTKVFTLAAMTQKASGALGIGGDDNILRSFKMTAENGHLRCVATDMDLTVIAHADGVEVNGEGSVVMPAQRIKEILKELPAEETIEITIEDPRRASIRTGVASWTVLTDRPDDYPEIPDPVGVNFAMVDKESFASSLAKVAPACATDGLRPQLMVIDVTGDRMRAHDGVRLHIIEQAMPFSFQLPIGAVPQLRSFLRLAVGDQIGFAQTEEAVLVQVDDDVLLITGVVTQFPDVKQHLQSVAANKRTMMLERTKLISAIRRVRISADEDSRQIEIIAEQAGARIQARNRMEETSVHALDTEWRFEPTRVVLNADYLLDALLAHEKSTVILAVGENETTPVAVLGDRGLVTILKQLRL